MRRSAALPAAACLLALLIALPGAALAAVVADDSGRQVEVPDDPQRIITLTPSLTEVVYALGLGERMVGSVSYSYYPPPAAKLPRVGAYMRPNLEKIVALNPDLVLASRENNPAWVWKRLTDLGVPVYLSTPDSIKTLPDNLAKLGAVCGRPQEGRRLADGLQAELDGVARRLKGAPMRPVLLVVGNNPIFSVGDETIHGQLIAMAHGKNLAAEAPGAYPQLSPEFVIAVKPRVVVLTTMGYRQLPPEQLAHWRSMPLISEQPGYRVEVILSDLIDRPGPRLGQGLEALARAIHPECFTDEPAGADSKN
jgi:iron complex transport system substrate-binding protein